MNSQLIKPYFLFGECEKHYVLNINDMHASIIPGEHAEILKQLRGEKLKTVSLIQQQVLEQLGLLSKPKKTTAKNPFIESYPIVNMFLFLTQTCNLKCVYCYGKTGSYGSKGNMSKKTAFQAVDWLLKQSGEKKKIHITFLGGEPFLNFRLMQKVVHYTRQRCLEADKRVDFHTISNGTLLDQEKIAFIDRENIDVTISIDGPKEIHDSQRPFASGQGSYDAVFKNSRNLLKVKPQTPAHAVQLEDHAPNLIKNALLDIGFNKISVTPHSNSLFDNQKKNLDRATDKNLIELELEAQSWIDSIQQRKTKALVTLKAKSQLQHAIIALLHNKKLRHACGAGLGMVAVSCAGDVFLCHRFVGMPNYKLGSIFSDELDRERYQQPVDMNAKCADCFARYYCGGGCKHDNAGSCGNIFNPGEDLCQLRRRELELAGTVVASLNQDDRDFLIEQEIYPPKPCPLDFG